MSEDFDLAARLTPKRGREPRSESFATRFTKRELAHLSLAAHASGKTLREWSREALLLAAGSPDDALFTELVATQLLLVNLLKPMLLGKPVPDNWIGKATSGVHAAKHNVAATLRKEYTVREKKGLSNGDSLG